MAIQLADPAGHNGKSDANVQATNNRLLREKFAAGIGAADIADGSIGTAELADNAVTQAKMADNSVGTAEILDDNVTVAKILQGSDGAVLKSASGTTAWSSVGGNGAVLYNTSSDVAWSDAPAADEILRAVGSVPTWMLAPIRVLNQTGTSNDVVSTLSETTLYSFTIPGGTIPANGCVVCTVDGDYLNDTGVNRNLTLKIKLGSTTFYGDLKTAIPASGTRRVVGLQFIFGNRNSVSAQYMKGAFAFTSSSAASVAGIGTLDQAANVVHFGASDQVANEDTATSLLLDVTVQHSASSASLSIRRRYACLTLYTA